MYKPHSTLFNGECYNLLSDILAKVSGVCPKGLSTGNANDKEKFYSWLENTGYTCLVVEMCDAMEEMGLVIKNDGEMYE